MSTLIFLVFISNIISVLSFGNMTTFLSLIIFMFSIIPSMLGNLFILENITGLVNKYKSEKKIDFLQNIKD